MNFSYSRQGLDPNEAKRERLLETVPGLISWTVITGICVLSVARPMAAAVVMIAFLLYWLLRLLYMNLFLVLSFIRLAVEKETDWMRYIAAVDRFTEQGTPPECGRAGRGWKTRLAARVYRGQMSRLKDIEPPPLSKDIYHLVIIPVVRETRQIVGPGIRAVKEGVYPAGRFLVVIALEEAASDGVKRDMDCLAEEHRADFLDILVTVHPAGQPGEARVKGANATYAAKQADKYFRDRGIPAANVLVSCFDADSVPDPQYFACLTYYFMISPDRLRSSYQPVPVYHNNIWDAPAFARVVDIGTSFFQLIEATNPNKLVTFSSHSMSFQALREVGYWPADMISDDSAIYWKAFLQYDGQYHVVPIYTTVSMDIATGPTALRTLGVIYRQKRRWACGVENFPIVVRGFLRSQKIPWRQKFSHGFKLLDGFLSWSTWSFLLLFGTWLPGFFASRAFESSTVYYTAPRVWGIMFNLASVGLLVCMVISLLLLPKMKIRNSWWVRIRHALEWLLIPFILVFLSALPALDAQTRLMLGRYMEFGVTEKYRRGKGRA